MGSIKNQKFPPLCGVFRQLKVIFEKEISTLHSQGAILPWPKGAVWSKNEQI